MPPSSSSTVRLGILVEAAYRRSPAFGQATADASKAGATLRRLADNQAQHEYRTNQRTADDYRRHLDARLSSTRQFTAQWMRLARERQRVDEQEARRQRQAASGGAGGFAGRVAGTVAGTLGRGGLVAGGAILAGEAIRRTAGRGADVAGGTEQALNVLQFQARATGGEMARISALARELGADLKLPATSSTDAARAMLELSKAGLSVNDVLAGARGTLALAAAASIDAADAANITAGALKAFGLEGKEAERVADLLAAAANNSLGDITDMAASLQQSSAAAAALNIPIQDNITAISLLANAGVKGSDAGTSLRVMFGRLIPTTKAAKEAMKALEISVFDANGKLLPMREIVGLFSNALSGATDQQRKFVLQTIFGEDAQRAANIVMTSGVAAYDEMARKTGKAGEASGTAAAKAKGYAGAVAGLDSTWETFLEKRATPAIKFFTDVINAASGGLDVLDKWIDRIGRLAPAKPPKPFSFVDLTTNAGPTAAQAYEKAGKLQNQITVLRDLQVEARTGRRPAQPYGSAGGLGTRMTEEQRRQILEANNVSAMSGVAEIETAIRRLARERDAAKREGAKREAREQGGGAGGSAAGAATGTAFTRSALEAIGRSVRTPAGQQSCGYFTSAVLQQMGKSVPTQGNARALEKWVAEHGAKQIPVAQARPGDVLVGPGTGPSGRHIGVSVGGGLMMDSSGAGPGKQRFGRQVGRGYVAYRTPEQFAGQGNPNIAALMAGEDDEAKKAAERAKRERENIAESRLQAALTRRQANQEAIAATLADLLAVYQDEHATATQANRASAAIPGTIQALKRARAEEARAAFARATQAKEGETPAEFAARQEEARAQLDRRLADIGRDAVAEENRFNEARRGRRERIAKAEREHVEAMRRGTESLLASDRDALAARRAAVAAAQENATTDAERARVAAQLLALDFRILEKERQIAEAEGDPNARANYVQGVAARVAEERRDETERHNAGIEKEIALLEARRHATESAAEQDRLLAEIDAARARLILPALDAEINALGILAGQQERLRGNRERAVTLLRAQAEITADLAKQHELLTAAEAAELALLPERERKAAALRNEAAQHERIGRMVGEQARRDLYGGILGRDSAGVGRARANFDAANVGRAGEELGRGLAEQIEEMLAAMRHTPRGEMRAQIQADIDARMAQLRQVDPERFAYLRGGVQETRDAGSLARREAITSVLTGGDFSGAMKGVFDSIAERGAFRLSGMIDNAFIGPMERAAEGFIDRLVSGFGQAEGATGRIVGQLWGVGNALMAIFSGGGSKGGLIGSIIGGLVGLAVPGLGFALGAGIGGQLGSGNLGGAIMAASPLFMPRGTGGVLTPPTFPVSASPATSRGAAATPAAGGGQAGAGTTRAVSVNLTQNHYGNNVGEADLQRLNSDLIDGINRALVMGIP